MKTEDLNEYIFANLVDDCAHKLWRSDTEKLIELGASTKEAIAKNPARETYFPTALSSLKELKKRVFLAQQESVKESD